MISAIHSPDMILFIHLHTLLYIAEHRAEREYRP